MQRGYEGGRTTGQAFVREWTLFRNKSHEPIIVDLSKRVRDRRIFRIRPAGKVRFVAGLSSAFLIGTRVELSRQDYAQITGLHRVVFDRILVEDPSLAEVIDGREKKAEVGYRKPGPSASLVGYSLRDAELRRCFKDDPDFCRGFVDYLSEYLPNSDLITSKEMETFADTMISSLQSRGLRHASIEYCSFVKGLNSSFQELMRERIDPKQHAGMDSDLRLAYRSKARDVGDFLTALASNTTVAVKRIGREEFMTELANSSLNSDAKFLRGAWSDLMLASAMQYFVSPLSSNEFAEYTEFFRAASGG